MDLNVHFWRPHRILNGPHCPFLAVAPRTKWSSISIAGGPSAYYWTSMPIQKCRNSLRGFEGRRAQGAAAAARRRRRFPKSPVPPCPGTKYPVRGIPHVDIAQKMNASSALALGPGPLHEVGTSEVCTATALSFCLSFSLHTENL